MNQEISRAVLTDAIAGGGGLPAIRFSVPWPPSENNYRRAKAIYSKKERKWFAQVYKSPDAKQYPGLVIQHLNDELGLLSPEPGRLALVLRYVFPNRRSRDIDNPLKGLLDGLTAARVWVDDEQVDFLMIDKFNVLVEPPGRIDCRLLVLPDSQMRLFEW